MEYSLEVHYSYSLKSQINKSLKDVFQKSTFKATGLSLVFFFSQAKNIQLFLNRYMTIYIQNDNKSQTACINVLTQYTLYLAMLKLVGVFILTIFTSISDRKHITFACMTFSQNKVLPFSQLNNNLKTEWQSYVIPSPLSNHSVTFQ